MDDGCQETVWSLLRSRRWLCYALAHTFLITVIVGVLLGESRMLSNQILGHTLDIALIQVSLSKERLHLELWE
jgi:hypothetical protein